MSHHLRNLLDRPIRDPLAGYGEAANKDRLGPYAESENIWLNIVYSAGNWR